ncbi:hypothetical protein [Tissierella sp.]|uniref:hypothetical protein n=1 Tax=Tissierella sp. TaxID=41274 RepID=UPI0030228A0C
MDNIIKSIQEQLKLIPQEKRTEEDVVKLEKLRDEFNDVISIELEKLYQDEKDDDPLVFY